MSESIWVKSSGQGADGRIRLTWDRGDLFTLTFDDGSQRTISKNQENLVIDESTGIPVFQIAQLRLVPQDSISINTLTSWKISLENVVEELPIPEEKTIDISKYARLLAEGLISIDDFELLTKPVPPTQTVGTSGLELALEKFILAISRTWPEIITSTTDVLGNITLSGAPEFVDENLVRRLLTADMAQYKKAIGTSSGLAFAWVDHGDGLSYPGMARTYFGGFMEGISGMSTLTKFFEKEFKKNRFSEQTLILMQRIRDSNIARQLPVREFATEMKWTGLSFID